MTLAELFEWLEMENPADFEYFEQFAALAECEEELSVRQIYTVLSDVEPALLAELTENYFEDIFQGIPDEATDFHLLMTNIQRALCGLAAAADEDDNRRAFAEELHRFRQWYLTDSAVDCTPIAGGPSFMRTVFDALAICRGEKLDVAEHSFQFGQALDYPVSEYMVTFVAAGEEEEEDSSETLVHKTAPVIDGQWSDS